MSVPAAPRPFDLASLLAASSSLTRGVLLRRLRVSGTTMRQLEAEGLTVRQADEFAVRVGLHPGDVWPTWWLVEPVAA